MEEEETLTQATILNDMEDAYAPVNEEGNVIIEEPETEEVVNEAVIEEPKETTEEISDAEAEAELTDNPYKFDLKIDGEELSKEYSKEDLIRIIQKSGAADKHLKESGMATTKMNGLLEDLKDPSKTIKILSRLMGADKVQELSQSVLSKQYDLSQMDDNTRELYERNQLLEAEKEERDSELETVRSEQENIEDARETEKLYSEMELIAPKYGLPEEERTYNIMASVIHLGYQNGQDITTDEAAKIVRGNMETDLNRFAGHEPIEKLIDVLGKDVMKKINKYNLDSVKDIPSPPKGSNYEKRGTSASKIEDEINEVNPEQVLQNIFLENADVFKGN